MTIIDQFWDAITAIDPRFSVYYEDADFNCVYIWINNTPVVFLKREIAMNAHCLPFYVSHRAKQAKEMFHNLLILKGVLPRGNYV